jgi:hypothetical protein
MSDCRQITQEERYQIVALLKAGYHQSGIAPGASESETFTHPVYAAVSGASIVDFSGQPWERAWSLHTPVSSRPPGF